MKHNNTVSCHKFSALQAAGQVFNRRRRAGFGDFGLGGGG
jgi:hypothetical protein